MNERQGVKRTRITTTGWRDDESMSEEPVEYMTPELLDYVRGRFHGDHDAAIEVLLHLSCLFAMTGEIDPEELRDRFGRVLESYTMVITVSLTPGGDA
jgi:hypothetical protein